MFDPKAWFVCCSVTRLDVVHLVVPGWLGRGMPEHGSVGLSWSAVAGCHKGDSIKMHALASVSVNNACIWPNSET